MRVVTEEERRQLSQAQSSAPASRPGPPHASHPPHLRRDDQRQITHDSLSDESPHARSNVGNAERWASLILGGALAAYGVSRRSLAGAALAALGAGIAYRGVSGRCMVYQSLGIDTARDGAPEPEDYFERGIHVTRSCTINKPREKLYAIWRDLSRLPSIMSHLKSVRVIDETRSRWTVEAPLGRTVEWDAEIINDEPNELIAWRSLEGASVDNAGSVRFTPAPNGRGTQVKVTLDYIPTGGRLGSMIAWLFGEAPSQQIAEDLRRFKAQLEAGEIPTTDGQPRGTCSGRARRTGRSRQRDGERWTMTREDIERRSL